jgi:hypothetical protein
MLRRAPSNIADLGDGGHIYELYVKPSVFGFSKAALHYAVALSYDEKPDRVFCFKVEPDYTETVRGAKDDIYIGSAFFTDTITEERIKRSFALIGAGKHRMACFVGENLPGGADKIKELADKSSLGEIAAALAPALPETFGITDLLRDNQKKIIDAVMAEIDLKTHDALNSIFEKQYPVLRELKYIGMELPKPFLRVADFVFSQDIKEELLEKDINTAQIEEILEDAASMAVPLSMDTLAQTATARLDILSKEFLKNPDKESAGAVIRFLKDVSTLPFKPDVYKTQENVFNGIQKLRGGNEEDAPFVRVLKKQLEIA